MQQTLFDNQVAHTRRTDPLSSYIAAEKVNVSKDELYVLGCVKARPDQTARQLGYYFYSGKPHRRMKGLAEKGLVTRTAKGSNKELHCNITERGREVLKTE